MSDRRGQFVWYELMTTDTGAAARFYADVVGWTPRAFGGPMDYTVLEAGGVGQGGIMKLPQEAADMGTPPCWLGYIDVEDVDAAAEKLKAKGGRVWREPTDIPEIGRFAVVADPQGATFILFQVNPRPAPPQPAEGTPGTVGWRELMTSDWEAALAFYSDMFGWTKDAPHDMGQMGVYQLFAYGGRQAGGMMNKPPFLASAPPFWNYYIYVDSVTAAVDRVKAGGGSVMNGPMEVPGGQWVIQARDPQGAAFCLLSDKA
jgi:predicted enzyme related to lactoylglutathione lyase